MSQTSTSTISRTLVGLVLVAWFLLVLLCSQLGAFYGNPAQPPLALGIAVLLPVLLFIVALYVSGRVRHFVAKLNIQTITYIQVGRILGGVFLVEYFLGALPGAFALPAGLGDVAIGLTAPFVASMIASQSRSRFTILLIWSILGLLDLVTAVSLGVLTSRSTIGVLAGAITSAPVTALPLSLIPTFLVPFYLILHLITLMSFRALTDANVGYTTSGV
jgi:hypothetical protein